MRMPNHLVLCAVIFFMHSALCGQTTGNIQGIVQDSQGRPIAKAKITLSKLGMHWVKDLFSANDGKFMQVGLEPKEYDITVSAQGFQDYREREKINLGLTTKKVYTLHTINEAVQATSPENKAMDSYSKAASFYNERKYQEAIPFFEESIARNKRDLLKTSEAGARKELEENLERLSKPYSVSLMESAKQDQTKKNNNYAKAEPIVYQLHQKNPKDILLLNYLLEISQHKNDKDATKLYQNAIDDIRGPRPETAINQGIELYNANKVLEARPFFKKAIEIDPNYADAYYFLAMADYADMNLKGTKNNLQKYLEKAPKGKYAEEVRALLEDPSLQNIH